MGEPTLVRFRRVLNVAYARFEERREEINDLNVFPVADGDTGDNMALTIRAVLDELGSFDGLPLEEVERDRIVHTVARAALLGARGNSGVILSQIVRGAAEELASRPGELIDPLLVSAALARSAEVAYESVRDPTEGTILTVIREMAHAVARRLAHTETRFLDQEVRDDIQDALLAEMLEEALRAGQQAVTRTPEQLDVLREAGVVDAGGHGLVVLLAGVIAGLRGEEDGTLPVEHHLPPPARAHPPHHADSEYTYCTNFVVTGSGLEPRSFVAPLEELGDSVLVVGDDRTLRVHVHCDDPEQAMAVFGDGAEVSQLDIADMTEQIAERSQRLGPRLTGVVAVCSGAGLRRLYEELGAHVVEGGPTMNPSTHEILAGIHAVGAEGVLVLPNSSNVRLAAERAAELSEVPTAVAGCHAQQQGLVALVELDQAAELEVNVERIEAALGEVTIGAIAPAARDDGEGRFVRGDAVGFLDREIVAWGGAGSTLAAIVEKLAAGAEIVTVVGGEDAPIALSEVPAHVPSGVDLELHEGGQPHWWWLLAAQ